MGEASARKSGCGSAMAPRCALLPSEGGLRFSVEALVVCSVLEKNAHSLATPAQTASTMHNESIPFSSSLQLFREKLETKFRVSGLELSYLAPSSLQQPLQSEADFQVCRICIRYAALYVCLKGRQLTFGDLLHAGPSANFSGSGALEPARRGHVQAHRASATPGHGPGRLSLHRVPEVCVVPWKH